MISINKLDKSFGPNGSFIGILILIAGLVVTYFSFEGLILVFIGAFVGFSSTSTTVDYDKKRVKFSNNIFGILPVGKWIYIKPGMKIGMKKIHKGLRIYSRSNRTLDTHSWDTRIILYIENKQIIHIAKFKTIETAKTELERLKNDLGLDQIQ